MLDVKMKEVCRICGRELCGNQRRWIFHPASKLNLQVLLSHALGQELTRDGRGEFACSKCTFMLDRMYRFDTVIARVEALSIERLQRLLQEKHRLKQCISGLYWRTNPEEGAGPFTGAGERSRDGIVDISGLTHAKYCALLQEDLVYSLYESWADDGPDCQHQHHQPGSAGAGSEAPGAGSHHCRPSTPRRCRGCSYWRVADSDYEAVCKVPRKLARSTSCGPSTRYSASVIGGSVAGGEAERKNFDDSEEAPSSSRTLVPGSQDVSKTSDSDRTLAGRASSSPSIASLETAEENPQPGAMGDGSLISPGETMEDHFSDSLSEEHMGAPLSSPGPGLSLALCLLQSYAAYRPVQHRRGSKLPVLTQRSFRNGGTRLRFPDPLLGVPYGERDDHMPASELDPPLVRLDLEENPSLSFADMEDLLEDLYREYPPPPPHQSLVEEQQSQLNQYECAAGQCVSELQKAQLQVQSLQAKIQESEANNMKLQEKLNEMECELRSLRQAAQSQERTIQGLTESVTTKDSEAQELYHLIESQNNTLCKLQELAHRNQLAQSQAPAGMSESLTLVQLQGELVRAQSSLFSLGLELDASQRSLRQSQRQGDDLLKFKDRLNSDLQEALQHREVTEKHNQDLRGALQKIRSELQTKETALKESEEERAAGTQKKDRIIAQLQRSLQDKEQQLQEYAEMLESTKSSKPRDVQLEKLRERIKERDRALERSIDDKFSCLEEREGQVRALQLALREKERDLERLRCILSNNEETITSLDALVRSKELELEQAAEAYRNLQWLKQKSEEKEKTALREKDAIIRQLQAALQARSQEMQDLTTALAARAQAGPTGVVEELKARLALKEKLFQELLSDRSRQTDEHQAQVQDLLNTLSSKDQYLQDYSYRLSLVISERTNEQQELRKQLTQTEQELSELRRSKEREMGGETEHLRSLLKEKEAFIKELIREQEEAVQEESEAEMKALKEEIHLVLRKEKEAQKEISDLRSSLAHRQIQNAATEDNSHHKCVLEQLVSEYNKLNDALRTEKRLYQNLTQLNRSDGSGSTDKIQTLHTELDSVQALRGQLEEVLSRTRSMALALERAAKRQPDFGEYSSEEEEEEEEEEEVHNEDGSSEEFTDSIEEEEEEDDSLNSIQASAKAQRAADESGRRVDGTLHQIKQLEEAKRTLDVQLEEVQSQLEEDGYTSLSEMRSALQTLQQENETLRESQGRPGAEGQRRNSESELHREEEEEGSSAEEEDEEFESSPVATGKRGPPCVGPSIESGKRQCMRPCSLDLTSRQAETAAESTGGRSGVGAIWQDIEEGLRQQAARLRSELTLSLQENRELKERLMVSEATVQAQAEQLKDYRDLLTETSVQQASKQVQVDLQDLGYETCGRSENEAEREDASSPEFDDLEMCTSLSQPQDCEGSSWYAGNCGGHRGAYDVGDESASLHHLVQDLRSQLSRCHKVIRGLQLRVRSLSATSDYASSLERTPRKVNWAFERSAAPSGVEEDEGWMSDTQGVRPRSRPSRELQELMERVASLEAQLKTTAAEGKGQAEEGKCATWPGKYNSLIQAQARELSHLRQRMREGQGVGHILTQHLGDTTKAFEELLRANDVDYYMGQCFREQLAQSSALAQRVLTKISGRDGAENLKDKTGHELLALRLSKELQQKDKLIESLHTKLQQRPETPSSCHALSETTDQSDHTSLVSDEYQSNEDLELSSDMAATDFQEEQRLRQQGLASEPDVRPSLPPLRGLLKASNSCPSMLCSATVGPKFPTGRAPFSAPHSSLSVSYGPDVWGYEVTSDPRPRALSVAAVRPELDRLYSHMHEQNRGFPVPQDGTLFGLSPGPHNQHDLSGYNQLSHHAFQHYQLGGIPEGHSVKSDSGLVRGRPLWDLDSLVQPAGAFSGNQTPSGQTGVNLMEEHLREVRCLRQRLEESIRTNEKLRQQLEEKLASTGRDGGAPTNIYIQGLDTVTQLSNEIRILKEENLSLQSRLQASTGTNEEVVQLQEAVLAARSRLKQAELEAEQWKEELRRLQAHTQEQGQQIHALRQERQANQDKTNRLQHEMSLLQQQQSESRELIHSLQSELHVYDRVCSSTKANKGYLCEVAGFPVELGELLGEVRSLRAQLQSSVQENSALKQLELHKQLEQKLGVGSPRAPSLSALTASPQRETFYRRQLLHDPAPSPPVRDIGLFNCGSPGPPYSDLDDSHSPANADALDPHSELEGEAPDGSFANRNGRHAIGHVDDFSALQQQVLEGRSLIQRMETTLQACLGPPLIEGKQKEGQELVVDYGCVKSLLSNTKTLRQILEEAMSLLKMFWRAALPNTDHPIQNLKKEQYLQEEILSLKLRISEQEEVLKGTVQRLRSTSRTKENMEHFIVNQLSRTRDVLKKARTNLEKNELRLSSLSSSPSSPPSAEDPGGAARAQPPDRGFLKSSGFPGLAGAEANQRLATRKRSSQCLL